MNHWIWEWEGLKIGNVQEAGMGGVMRSQTHPAFIENHVLFGLSSILNAQKFQPAF